MTQRTRSDVVQKLLRPQPFFSLAWWFLNLLFSSDVALRLLPLDAPNNVKFFFFLRETLKSLLHPSPHFPPDVPPCMQTRIVQRSYSCLRGLNPQSIFLMEELKSPSAPWLLRAPPLVSASKVVILYLRLEIICCPRSPSNIVFWSNQFALVDVQPTPHRSALNIFSPLPNPSFESPSFFFFVCLITLFARDGAV